MAVISDCYTICGVYKEFEITEDNFNANSKVSLIAEFSLREGASAKEFHNILRKEIKEKLEKLNLDKELIEKVNDELKDYYITFDSIDTLIVPKVNIESYLSLFMSEAFQPGSLFYPQFISGTKTSICVSEGTDTECSDDRHLSANCDNLNKDEGHEEWNQFSTDFEKKLKEKNYAVRMLRAIEQIIQNYYNIANTLHGFDIKRSLDAFISVTLDNKG